MKPEIRIRWAEALRSGEYTKGTGRLRRLVDKTICHCALGVLCDLYLKEVGGQWEIKHANMFFIDKLNTSLPSAVSEWAGLNSMSGVYLEGDGDVPTTIVGANDGRRLTFKEIADIVETANFL